jgi:hypothetical protein
MEQKAHCKMVLFESVAERAEGHVLPKQVIAGETQHGASEIDLPSGGNRPVSRVSDPRCASEHRFELRQFHCRRFGEESNLEACTTVLISRLLHNHADVFCALRRESVIRCPVS